jgi:hypothetical protein
VVAVDSPPWARTSSSLRIPIARRISNRVWSLVFLLVPKASWYSFSIPQRSTGGAGSIELAMDPLLDPSTPLRDPGSVVRSWLIVPPTWNERRGVAPPRG